MSDQSNTETLIDLAESGDLSNEIQLPTEVAALKADADAALEPSRAATVDANRNEARELEFRQQRLRKAIHASRDQVPFQLPDLDHEAVRD